MNLCFIFHVWVERTQEKRLERLRAAGATDRALAKIKGPAGLPIGAKTPAEIAVSVLAELIAAWRESVNAQVKLSQQVPNAVSA